MFDALIRGGTIIDGSGNPWFKGDVAISKGKIVQIGRGIRAHGRRIIDAEGLVVSPGWVDVHSHSDWSLMAYPYADSLLIQGATLTVTGNCGYSATPLVGVALERGERRAKTYTSDFEVDWSTFDGYLGRLERQGVSMNVASLVGHSTIRLCVMGHAERGATPAEMSEMERLVDQSPDRVPVRHVHYPGLSTAFPVPDLSRHGLGVLRTQVGHRHGSALGSERAADLRADPTAGAGNQGYAVREFHIDLPAGNYTS